MDAELKALLEKIAGSLESRIEQLRSEFRTEILEVEARLNARIDGVGRLSLDANRTFRTRDLRILTLEERMGEVE